MIVVYTNPVTGVQSIGTSVDEDSVFTTAKTAGNMSGYISPSNGDTPQSVVYYVATRRNLSTVSPAVTDQWSGR